MSAYCIRHTTMCPISARYEDLTRNYLYIMTLTALLEQAASVSVSIRGGGTFIVPVHPPLPRCLNLSPEVKLSPEVCLSAFKRLKKITICQEIVLIRRFSASKPWYGEANLISGGKNYV